jgi:DNA-binding transcriptional regulator PaaX
MKTTNKNRLENYLRHRGGIVRTSEILAWGAGVGYSNTACRDARKLANEGKIRRISRTEKILSGLCTNEGIYEVLREGE